jgi:hypothetical protein
LSDAQRAEHHVRREEILKRKGLVNAKPGPAKVTDKLSATQSYAAKAAADLGVDERTVRRDLARGKKIAPEVLSDVAGTELDKGVVLDELARVPRVDQPALLDEIRLQAEVPLVPLSRFSRPAIRRAATPSCRTASASLVPGSLSALS